MRTRVYEIEVVSSRAAVHTMRVMVEDWPDGTQTIAFKVDNETTWGIKHSPVMDDDGDHLREPENLPVISDDEYAKYLNGESL